MFYFFVIRFKQFYRIILELGILRSLFFLVGLVFVYYLHLKYYYLKGTFFIPVSYILLILSMHVSRKDKEFVKLFFNRTSSLFFLEYLLVVLPLFIVAFIANQWMHIFGIFIFLFVLAFFFPMLNYNFRSRFIIKYDFKMPEWYAGTRKNGFLLFILNVFSLLFFKNMSVQIGIILLVSLILMSFFINCESKEMLESFSVKGVSFLRNKVMMHLKYAFFILIIPLCLLLVFNAELFYLAFVLLVIVISMQLFAIYLKYAFYEQGEVLTQNSTFHMLFFIGFIFPFFTPVAMYFLFNYRKKAIENLKSYLNDSN